MNIPPDLPGLERGRPTILTMGAFDGVHRGHQYLIRQVVERARAIDCDSLVLTFDPRPLVVLRPGESQLTTGEDKARLIGALGPSSIVVLPFTLELAQLPADAFLRAILERVNLAEIWIGADFAFGHNREGTAEFVIGKAEENCFAVHVVPRQRFDGVSLSSSVVRSLIVEGDIAQAARLLGHYPTLGGRVVPGYGRGAELGFPTANVRPPPSQLLPAVGIYAGYLRSDEEHLPTAIYVGPNAVFGGTDIVVEAHVLDFEGDLRGREVTLEFVARVREDRAFDGIDRLVEQIAVDVTEVRKILAGDRDNSLDPAMGI